MCSSLEGSGEAGDDQDFRQTGPGNLRRPAHGAFLCSIRTLRKEAVQEFTQAKLLQELQGKPDVAKAAGSLNADLADIDLDPFGFSLIEEGLLDRGISFGRVLDFESSCFIHVSNIGDDAMARTTLGPYRLHERPVVVPLAAFVDRDLAEEHAANIQHDSGPRKGEGFHYMDF